MFRFRKELTRGSPAPARFDFSLFRRYNTRMSREQPSGGTYMRYLLHKTLSILLALLSVTVE